MTFDEVWSQVKGLPETAVLQVPNSLSEKMKRALSKKPPEEVARIVLEAIEEVNQRSVVPLNELIKKTDDKTDVLEKQLLRIWIEVLQCEVNCDDNFIELGGNSLTASQMLEKIKNNTGIIIGMEEFYENSDFKDMLKLIKMRGVIGD